MDRPLDANESRVLACLVEKQVATPEYYPMTLNALVNACNQRSNRDPVVALCETEVQDALDSLREIGLTRKISGPEHRVPKYDHLFHEKLDLSYREAAILCELMLRGPQTIGELRAHAGRLYDFKSAEDTEEAVATLLEPAGERPPLAVRLPRQPGRKEPRVAHLLCGPPVTVEQETSPSAGDPSPAHVPVSERVAVLEAEISSLRSEIANLKEIFNEFKKQFE